MAVITIPDFSFNPELAKTTKKALETALVDDTKNYVAVNPSGFKIVTELTVQQAAFLIARAAECVFVLTSRRVRLNGR